MSYDENDALQDEYDSYLVNEFPKELHENAIKGYLGVYGDAIDERLNRLQTVAEEFLKQGLHDFSIVAASTAMEIIIKYFCIKPLVEGAFLSELWAAELSKKIVDSRIADNRGLFQTI